MGFVQRTVSSSLLVLVLFALSTRVHSGSSSSSAGDNDASSDATENENEVVRDLGAETVMPERENYLGGTVNNEQDGEKALAPERNDEMLNTAAKKSPGWGHYSMSGRRRRSVLGLRARRRRRRRRRHSLHHHPFLFHKDFGRRGLDQPYPLEFDHGPIAHHHHHHHHHHHEMEPRIDDHKNHKSDRDDPPLPHDPQGPIYQYGTNLAYQRLGRRPPSMRFIRRFLSCLPGTRRRRRRSRHVRVSSTPRMSFSGRRRRWHRHYSDRFLPV